MPDYLLASVVGVVSEGAAEEPERSRQQRTCQPRTGRQ